MKHECDLCDKKARWIVVEMEKHDDFCDGHENPVELREAYFMCGEHKQKEIDVYAIPIGEAIPIRSFK